MSKPRSAESQRVPDKDLREIRSLIDWLDNNYQVLRNPGKQLPSALMQMRHDFADGLKIVDRIEEELGRE